MDIPKEPWTYSADELVNKNEVSTDEGLSTSEIEKRREKFGNNTLQEKEKKSAWSILFDQVKSIIMILLASAAIVSFSFGEFIQAIAIVAVIIITIFIGFATEIRAVRSMESLKKMAQVNAVVRRNGEIKKIPAKKLVPGDIVIIESGDVVTADLRLIEANKLQSDESTLTGESVPVSKSITSLDKDTSLEQRTNMLFKGTLITKGSGMGIVISTGKQTELGRISSLVEEAEEEITPLEKRIKVLGRKLVWATLSISAIVGLLGVIRGKELLLMIETAIALAVAAIPEGLPIVATIALAQGMLHMAKRNALINRLSSVETLGSTNVIFSDKTGTLTLNKMTVTDIAMDSGNVTISNKSEKNDVFSKNGNKISVDASKNSDLFTTLLIGVLCNNASLQNDDEQTIVGDPIEIALLDAGKKAGMKKQELLDNMPEEHEEAFDPEKKMMGTINKKDDSFFVAVKGAPESVLNHCTYILKGERVEKLTKEEKKVWKDKNDEMAENGLRVLAVSYKEVNEKETDVYTDLVFTGLIGLLDPPRKEIKEYIKDCKQAGINIVMVTGDHPGTAQNIAKDISLVTSDHISIIQGKDLKAYGDLSEKERKKIINTNIFARVSPAQKLDLISIYQQQGSIVAMTGDGVNDAPALKKADIGIAMGKRGTQVAQEASDMVLQDDSFSSIVTAIQHGRVIFSNIRKFILFLLSGNIGEITAVALASFSNIPLPITPLQILYVNLMLDIFPALALGIGKGGPDVMEKPPRDQEEPFLTKNHWMIIIVYGFVIAFSILLSLYFALEFFKMPVRQAVTVSFLTLTFARLWHVFNMRDKDSSMLRNEITKNPFVWGAIALCASLIFAAVYLPGLSEILETVNPGFNGWIIVITMSIIPYILGQIGLLFADKINR